MSAGDSQRPVAQSKAARDGSGLPARHSMPTCRAKRRSGLPSGWCIHEPPRSTPDPPRSAVYSRPPIRRRASSTTQSTAAWAKALATVSPAIPAPITSTRSTRPTIPPGISGDPSSKLAVICRPVGSGDSKPPHSQPARFDGCRCPKQFEDRRAVAARFRDLMMPLVFPMVYPRATGWLYEDEVTPLDR